MSVATHLEGTASALLPKQDERDSITRSILTLQSRLTAYFGSDLKEQVQFGSSTRGTMLPRKADPNSDVDYMVVFDNGDDRRPDTFIQRLRRFAEKKYGSSEIYRSHPTVVLSLNHIMFELVPAHKSWGTLYIPASAKSFSEWISTDPNGFNEKLQDKNKDNDSQIKPLIRLLKYWNALNGYVFDSYGLEKWVVSNFFLSSKHLRPYFYEAVNDIRGGRDLAQWRIDKIDRAKALVASTKVLEERGDAAGAEKEIKKLIPPIQ